MLSEEIIVRNPNLNWREQPSRAWFGGSSFVSNWMNAFSTTFPAGERFFIESVRFFLDEVDDPALRENAWGFIGQEGMHAREHQQFNDLLRAQGYPVDRMDALVRKILDFLRRRQTAGIRLAATCALEHFTTILSTAMLRSPEVHQAMSGESARLWCWHWVEELEHKSVAFDVYRAIGGRYFHRILVMVGTTLVMWPLVFYIVLEYMAHDRRLLSPREWWKGVAWAFLRPGVLRRVVLPYLAYFRPGYHPSQNVDAELLAQWRDRLERR